MPTRDEEQFAVYLKRFHPIAPEPAPTLRVGDASRRSLSPGTWLAAVAAVVLIGAAIFDIRSSRVVVPNTVRDVAYAERRAPFEPFTMRSANAWLATAPSLIRQPLTTWRFVPQPAPFRRANRAPLLC